LRQKAWNRSAKVVGTAVDCSATNTAPRIAAYRSELAKGKRGALADESQFWSGGCGAASPPVEEVEPKVVLEAV